MLSGSLPPGISSTPDNGKIGSVSGSCSKTGSKGLRAANSGKQDGRQPLAAVDGQRIGKAQRLEELQELRAGGLFVPLAVGLDHGKQLVDRFLALVAGPIGEGEVEARLEVLGISRRLGLELAERARRLGLLGKIDRRLDGDDVGVGLVLRRHARQDGFGLVNLAGLQM